MFLDHMSLEIKRRVKHDEFLSQTCALRARMMSIVEVTFL